MALNYGLHPSLRKNFRLIDHQSPAESMVMVKGSPVDQSSNRLGSHSNKVHHGAVLPLLGQTIKDLVVGQFLLNQSIQIKKRL
jgi:hypothetical protein